MAMKGGQILHIGGSATIIDRLQSAGLGDVNIGTDTIRETGNYLNVDKVLQDPDLTFSMESLDVTTEIEALLCGFTDGGTAHADGTEYLFSDMGALNIISPWKSEAAGSAGTVDGGVVLPGYYVSRASYRFGVDDNAGETFELSGSEAYLARYLPVNEEFTLASGTTAYQLAASAVLHRVGGYDSTEYKHVLGVVVDGVTLVEDTDYTVNDTSANPELVTVTLTSAPTTGSKMQVAYFSTATAAFNDNIFPTATVKPGAVRGRDIKVYFHVNASGAEASGRVRIGGVQSVTAEATKNVALEREMGALLPIGRTVESQDVNGEIGLHPASQTAFFQQMRRITGVASSEVIGIINDFQTGIEIEILDPSDRGTTLKTLFIEDAKIQVPGTPARAGAVIDFSLRWESVTGELYIYKGARP